MDFSKLLGFGIFLSISFTINISALYAGEVKNTFGNDSVSVESSWTSSALFKFENIEQNLADALSKNTVFKRVSIGGRATAKKKVIQRSWSDFEDFVGISKEVLVETTQTYLFLKPSYDKLPVSLVTLERTGAAPTAKAPAGSAHYVLVDPTHFYFDYVDVGRRPFDISQAGLSLDLIQAATDVTLTTTFRVNQLSFVSWMNTFLAPLRTASSQAVDVKDILVGMRMVFEAIHQYFAQHY